MVPTLQRCCCFDLRKGCIFIACFYGAKAVIMVLLTSYSAYRGYKNAQKADTEEYQRLYFAVGVTSIVMAVFSGAETVSSILLLKGITESKPKFMFPWMVLCVADLTFSSFLFISAIVLAIFFEYQSEFIWTLFAEPVKIGLSVYFHVVVHSHYKQLKSVRPDTPETTAPTPGSTSSVTRTHTSQPATPLTLYLLQVPNISPIQYLPHKRLSKVGDAPGIEHIGSLV